MAETDQQQSQEEASKKGVLTPEQLAALVALDPSFAKSFKSGSSISEGDAISIFEGRYGAWKDPAKFFDEDAIRSSDVYRIIWQSLPEEMRTREVASAIDVRPYLEALNGKRVVGTGWRVGAQELNLDFAIQVADSKMREQLTGTLPTDLDPAERTAQLDRLLQYTPGTAGIDIRVNTTGQTQTGTAGFDPTKIIDEQTLFPVAELREMVRTGEVSIAQLEQYERAQIEAGMTGVFGIEVGAERPVPYAPEYMGVRQAMAYLSTLSEQEVGNLQRKMAAAGYYDRTGSGAGYVTGDSMDPVTLEAWKLVLFDAAAANKSVPAVMMDGMQNYRTQVREARMRDIEKVDPRYSATLASDYAMSVVGRGLSTEEQAELNKYLTDLVQRRAGYVAGASNPGIDGPLAQTAEGYSGTDVQMWVSQQTAAESARLASAERWSQ